MFGQKSQVCHAATPSDADAFRKRMAFNDIGKRVRKSASTERSQHSSPKTTLFFGNGHAFGRKYAILSIFAQPPDIQHITDFHHHSPRQISHCALQNMPNRTAKHARSHRQTCPIEPRLGIFRNSKHARSPAPALFSPLAFRKNGHFARSFTRNCDTTFSPKNLTSYAPPTNLRPSPAAPSPWPLFSYSTDGDVASW